MTVPEQPSDPDVRLVDLPSGPVAITDVGEGPALLMLHGAPGSVRDWRWLGPVVEPHLRLVRIDFPGFGSTPRATQPSAGFPERAALVLGVADALGLERFAVLGHSQGGALAMHVAANHPERVTRLALIGSVGMRPHRPVRKQGNIKLIAGLLRFPPTRWLLMPTLRRTFVKIGFPKSTPDQGMVQTIQWTAVLDFAMTTADVARLTVPTLLASTGDDPFIDQDITAELGAALPDGPRLAWPAGGHNMQKTWAVELGEALVAFLTGTE